MTWYKKFISETEIAKVTEAVRKVEERTSGEIVPMIVRRSSAIGHVPLLLLFIWIIFAFTFYIAAEYWWHNWASPWWYFACGILGAPLFLQLSRLDYVQRILTSNADETLQVFNRAQLEFDNLRIKHTQAQTGILIFLSIMEHRCVVLADQSISKKLPPETWQAVVDKVILGIKSGKTGEGLVAAIENCGNLLTEHFPLGPNDKNELANALVIKE